MSSPKSLVVSLFRCWSRRPTQPLRRLGAPSTAVSRCWPARPAHRDILLVSPIILYDHPEVAEQSSTALYDCTEIDEILTLRVMTMTDEEKAQARATDPRAAQIIDRCDAMSPDAMARLHGVLRDPHALHPSGRLVPEIPEGIDWWDPLVDNAVRPDIDAVLVNGIRVARGSRVRLRPRRNADAQDIFVRGQDRATSPRSMRTSRATSTSGSSSTTTPPPTCTTGTAATCTSLPTKSSHCRHNTP